MSSCLLRVEQRVSRCLEGLSLRVRPESTLPKISHRSWSFQTRPCAQQRIRKPACVYKTATFRSCSSLSSTSTTTQFLKQLAMTAPGDAEKYRLPTNVRPTHYDVTVKTDLEALTFQGLVKIEYVSPFNISISFLLTFQQP